VGCFKVETSHLILCTLFNKLYLPQGLALYRSLLRTASQGFVLHVLCMDDFTAEVLERMALPCLNIIRLDEIEDDTLRAVKATRSIGEYCWTCTTPLLLHVLGSSPPNAVVAYIDADIRFFSDPGAIFEELGDGSIYVHEHNFASEYASLVASAGRFNVGVVAFRNDRAGRQCLERWKAQCIDECVMDPEAGKCGDQNYLDEWPELYPSLVISQHSGVGLAPWNISKYSIKTSAGRILSNGRTVVFYHYHSLRALRPSIGVKPIVMAKGYELKGDVIDVFYRPYARDLWREAFTLQRNSGFSIADFPKVSEAEMNVYNQQMLLCYGRFIVLVDCIRYKRYLKLLFGVERGKAN
jgi:hypothetical protein